MVIRRKRDFLRHYFSKATVVVDIFEQNIYQTISLITSCTNMYQLFVFMQTFSRYQRHNIDALTSLL